MYVKEDVRLVNEGRFLMAMMTGNDVYGGSGTDKQPGIDADNNADWLYSP